MRCSCRQRERWWPGRLQRGKRRVSTAKSKEGICGRLVGELTLAVAGDLDGAVDSVLAAPLVLVVGDAVDLAPVQEPPGAGPLHLVGADGVGVAALGDDVQAVGAVAAERLGQAAGEPAGTAEAGLADGGAGEDGDGSENGGGLHFDGFRWFLGDLS